MTPPDPHFGPCPGAPRGEKKSKFLSRLGELLNTQKNVHFLAPPGGPPGGPRWGTPLGYPPVIVKIGYLGPKWALFWGPGGGPAGAPGGARAGGRPGGPGGRPGGPGGAPRGGPPGGPLEGVLEGVQEGSPIGPQLDPCLGPSAMANASGAASQPNARGDAPVVRHSHGCVAVDSRDRPRHSVSPHAG